MGDIYKNALTVLVWLGRVGKMIVEDCFAAIQRTNTYLHFLFVVGGREHWEVPRMTAPFPIPVDRPT